jgi:hypothetical protein
MRDAAVDAAMLCSSLRAVCQPLCQHNTTEVLIRELCLMPLLVVLMCATVS